MRQNEELLLGREGRDAVMCYSPELREWYSKELEREVNMRKQDRKDREEKTAALLLKKK